MRRNRQRIGQRSGRRNSDGVSIVRPIADGGEWSGGTDFDLVNEPYNYPILSTDSSSATAAEPTDNGIEAKWFFGGMNNGPSEINKIQIFTRHTRKLGDSVAGAFVLKGESFTLSFGPLGWNADTIYGSWKMEDFMSRTPDLVSGPYVGITPDVANTKDVDIFNIQLWLYGK